MTKEYRDSFICYRSFIEAARDLPKEERIDLYEAIFDLALDEKENTLSGIASTIFKVIKPNLLANTKRYKDGKKGAEFGKKGGRPKTKNIENNPTGVLENNPTPETEKTPNKNKNNNNNKNKDEELELIIPNFIDQILFDEFLQQRKKDKNPIEGLALKLTLEDLEKWENRNKGNANLALKNTIKGGWKSLVEPKTNDCKKIEIEDDFCKSLNQSLGQDLIKSLIEGEVIIIKLHGASANDKWDSLSSDLKESVLAKVKAKFGKETKISF